MQIEIRDAKEQDLETITTDMIETQNLHVKAFPDIYIPIEVEAMLEHLRIQLKRNDVHFKAAICNGEVCGHTLFEVRKVPKSLFTYSREYIYLMQIIVKNSYRKKSVGTILMRDVCKFARLQNIAKIELDVWSFNERARNFFAKQGFCDFGYRMRLLQN